MRYRLSAEHEKLLVQPSQLPQTTETANISQAEIEKKQILVAHVGDRVRAVLQRHAAAIPIVSRLRADELQLGEIGVKAETSGGAEAALDRTAVSYSGTKLVEAGDISQI
jgi:hypothetical protein